MPYMSNSASEGTFDLELENSIISILNNLQAQQQQKLSTCASNVINDILTISRLREQIGDATLLLEKDSLQAKTRADQLKEGLCATKQQFVSSAKVSGTEPATGRASPFFPARVSPPIAANPSLTAMSANKTLEEDF